ncbi:VTT domain-containing protein [Aurantiacibacter gangjinensis]|uniref:TVP38/TMEM64 family membrane protein n=1 Tax=Aurantiacibacter gangjinensis TaxID=502682 RepID=A0A0G9MR38_9SPHN|nr:VTT domain-containing protein [Aurantiacibacter gangjinensis]APE27786.1 hypothetical protein BMF35_a0957 [Aurantiacibacter gangjinensis]KLE31778.1 hypothetical protein AAW01_09760 [Aurantiacibacter gangjinensis]
MESLSASILPLALLKGLAMMPGGMIAVAAIIAAATASLVAFSVPGAVTPMSFLSGLMLGIGGILAVALGVLVGSHLLFLVTRRWLGPRMNGRFGPRLEAARAHLSRRGPAYVVGARLGGVPHLLVTAACAATPITARQFLAASLLGMLPAISLAAVAGSGVAAI